MNPIFEPGDFLNQDMSPPTESLSRFGLLDYQAERIANSANAKLQSLGIDAEITLEISRLTHKLVNAEIERDAACWKIEAFERMIAEAPYAYMAKGYGHYDKWTTNYSDLDARPSHRARLVQIEEID